MPVMTKRPPSATATTVSRSNSLPEVKFVGMEGKEQVGPLLLKVLPHSLLSKAYHLSIHTSLLVIMQ